MLNFISHQSHRTTGSPKLTAPLLKEIHFISYHKKSRKQIFRYRLRSAQTAIDFLLAGNIFANT
jgi:hypothetical protein